MPSDQSPKRNSPKPPRLPRLLLSRAKGAVKPTAGVTFSEDLQRFRRGELTETEYLQTRIDRAMLHLRGRVSSRKLDRIRKIVTEAFTTDPVFLAMRARLLGPPGKAGE